MQVQDFYLPDIPEDVLATHRYAVIFAYMGATGSKLYRYELICGSSPLFARDGMTTYYPGDYYSVRTADKDWKWYQYHVGGTDGATFSTDWEEVTPWDEPFSTLSYERPVMWSNHEIYFQYPSSSGGEEVVTQEIYYPAGAEVYQVDRETLARIARMARFKSGRTDLMTPAQIVEAIGELGEIR